MDFEGELAVVIGKHCRNARADEDVRAYIRGYTCLNDVTARDLQRKDGQWTRGKGFDTFCPVGPVMSDEPDPWKGVTVETRVNGELKQHGTTSDFIFPLDEIIRYCSQVMTLAARGRDRHRHPFGRRIGEAGRRDGDKHRGDRER